MTRTFRQKYFDDFYRRFYHAKSSSPSHRNWRLLSASYKAKNVLKALPQIGTFKTILEVGSGTGELAHYLVSHASCPAIHLSDVSESALSQALQNYPNSIASTQLLTPGENLPYNDNSFDVAICSHVLEHVVDPVHLLNELLRTASLVFVEVPIDFRYYAIPTNDLLAIGHIHAFSASTIRFYIDQAKPTILSSGYSYTQHALPLSLFHVLDKLSFSRKPFYTFLLLSLSFIRWLLVWFKLRLRSFFGNPGTEAFYLLRKP